MSIESSAGKRLLVATVWTVLLGTVLAVIVLWWKPFSKHRIEQLTGSESRYKHRIVLRDDSFTGYCVLRCEAMTELLAKEGILLAIEDDKADYAGRMRALKDDKADLAVFTVDSLLVAGAKLGEFPATIVMVIDETRGADAIVAYKSAVASIQDLNKAQARFVLTPDSPSEFLARVVVSDFNLPNLSARWITKADGAADVYERFRKASRTQPTAYVLWEPYVSKALAESGAHVLIGSDKIKGYIVDVLAARRTFLRDNPELVAKVVQAYLRAAYASRDSMAQLVMSDAKAAGEPLSPEEADRLVKGIQWKNTLENYAHFRLLSRQESLGLEDMEEIISKVARVLGATGAVAGERLGVQANTLFYDKIMKDLQSSDFHPGRKLAIVSNVAEAIDPVRGEARLAALSDQQWQSDLVAVGQMRIEPISFLRGTAELGIQSRRDLEDLAGRLKSLPRYYLQVVGHARSEGDPEANMLLAKQRADMAGEYLVLRLGVGRERVRSAAASPSRDTGDAQSVTFQLMQLPY
jgi:outer membrane protein OmpA-like peptidoglycan-associated protein